MMLFSLGQVGEGCVCFSLGQVLGLLCNPVESTQNTHALPCGRPADAKEYSNLGNRLFYGSLVKVHQLWHNLNVI